MKKSILILFSLLTFALAACGTAAGPAASPGISPESAAAAEPTATPAPTPEPTVQPTAEPTIYPDREWFSEDVFDEVRACLFPAEGQPDYEYARELLLPITEAVWSSSSTEAMYYMGYIHDRLEEEEKAQFWYDNAVAYGFPKAYVAAAYTGASVNTYYLEMARESGFFDLSPEELQADGCCFMGVHYMEQQEYDVALEWFLKAADMNEISAMILAGNIYYSVLRDTGTAMEWWRKAADRGEVLAIYGLGTMAADEATAMEWYQKAADMGHVDAMYALGEVYENFIHDNELAMNWYQKAAESGNTPAIHSIGRMYEEGKLQSADYDLAMEWYIKAYENGVEEAAASINRLLSDQRGVNAYFENYGALVYPNP